MFKNSLEKIEKYTRDTNEFAKKHSQTTFQKYPLIFSALVLFGVVATSKGFEMVVQEFYIFERYPFILFFIGIFILLSTGTLYRVIEKHK